MGQVSKIEDQRQPVARFSAPVLDDKLSGLLAAYRGLSDAPVIGPKAAAALERFVDDARAPMPERSDVERMLMLLDTVKRRRKADDAEGEAVQELYWHGLKDIALDDLRHAYDVLLKGSPWFPDISEIRKAAAGGPVSRHLRNVVAAKMLIRKHREEWREPVQPATPEQVAQVKAMMGEGKGA